MRHHRTVNAGFSSSLPDASASVMPETQDFNASVPSQAANLNTVPLGAAVPLHVRQNIWSNRFVDLGSLILKFKCSKRVLFSLPHRWSMQQKLQITS